MIDHKATTALIIGGTQGLGQAIAQELIDRGCTRIVIAGRDAERGGRA